uniref:Ras-associating domain-containing protein n=1 Tax=Anisakis simplex TaxID=6269 RepID=A0A0M3JWQ8_ANISI
LLTTIMLRMSTTTIVERGSCSAYRHSALKWLSRSAKHGFNFTAALTVAFADIFDAIMIVENDDVETLQRAVINDGLDVKSRITTGHLGVCGSEMLLNKIETLQKRTLREAKHSENSGLTSKEKSRQIKHLEKQLLQLRRMKSVVKNCVLLCPFTDVYATVTSSDTITVEWKKPRPHIDFEMLIAVKGILAKVLSLSKISFTRISVEWSLSDKFTHVEGEMIEKDLRNNRTQISGLRKGLRYSIRVSPGNIRGFGSPCIATPRLTLLSGWDDVIDNSKPDDSVNGINGLLQDEDMYWAMKLSLCWDELQHFNECSLSNSSNASFRNNFVDAVTHMQNAIGVKEIGRIHFRVHHETISCAEQSTIFLVTVRFVDNCHSIQILFSTVLAFFFRKNGHVTKEEWDWLRLLDIKSSNKPSPTQLDFESNIIAAATVLLRDLNIASDLIPLQRIYRFQVFELNFGVSFILMLPQSEEVCSAPSHSWEVIKNHYQEREYLSVPLPVFEMFHLSTYSLNLIATYCRLSVFLEHFITVVQYKQRNCLLQGDTKVLGQLLQTLFEFQRRLENVWKSARWIGRIASTARDKQSKCALPLSNLLHALNTRQHRYDSTDENNYENEQVECFTSHNNEAGTYIVFSVQNLFEANGTSSSNTSDAEARNATSIVPSARYFAGVDKAATISTDVIRIYTAYECGFSKGTSIRVQIASTTTSREVVALIISKFAKAASSVNIDEQTAAEGEVECDEYCLSAVVGSRERRLRDDF